MSKRGKEAKLNNDNNEKSKLPAEGRITDEIVIDVCDVYKSFRVYFDKGSMLKEQFVNPSRSRYENREILKGISFQIHRGETVALIGNNGCGKSTTLKMLTKILYPNQGAITINGKVSSLIELGAGFHPDMSGRENIYINASILGLKQDEIDRRIDEIIRFSELEEYIDNPIRTYSSGMYMRLAFSVAINVDADILLIDEILAVGDQAFQEKCFAKLNDLRQQGVTVVLVSHAMGQVNSIADRCIWIDDGRVAEDGDTESVCRHYEEEMESRRNHRDLYEAEERQIEEKELEDALAAIGIASVENDSESIREEAKKLRRAAFSERWKSDGVKGLPLAGTIAILLVLLCHASQDIYGIGYSDINNFYPEMTWKMRLAGFTLFTAGRIGIPLGLIVFGFKFLPEKYTGIKDILNFWRSKLLPLLCTWELWVIVYQFVGNDSQWNTWNWLRQALFVDEVPMSHAWFAKVVLSLVLITPFLSMAIQNIGAGTYRLVMIILWVLFFMFPGFDLYGQMNGGTSSFPYNMNWICYLFYYCMGYLFSLYSRRLLKGSREIIISFLLLAVTLVSQFNAYNSGLDYLVWYSYWGVSLIAVLGFDIVSRMRFEGIINTITSSIYKSAIGVFLIHRIIQQMLDKVLFDKIIGNFAIRTLGLWVSSFVISYGIIWVINKIPVIGKAVCGNNS